MGYVRYDSEEALEAMNDLYQNELRLFQNLFQPSVKLVRKVRVGSRVKRVYGVSVFVNLIKPINPGSLTSRSC